MGNGHGKGQTRSLVLVPKQARLKHDRGRRCFSRVLAIFAALFYTQ
jgi:hypothetical protein